MKEWRLCQGILYLSVKEQPTTTAKKKTKKAPNKYSTSVLINDINTLNVCYVRTFVQCADRYVDKLILCV
jgi:hypothetical protein